MALNAATPLVWRKHEMLLQAAAFLRERNEPGGVEDETPSNAEKDNDCDDEEN
jgi:hypothetical protein